MIIRIVKLQFQEERIEEFLAFFETIKEKVNNFPGCLGMQLLQDIARPNIFMTYSHWENEEALNEYRYSDTFKIVWPTIKCWFEEPADAWSLMSIFNGFQN